MKLNGWHCFFVLVIGYLLGYYFPQLAKGTIGTVLPTQAA